jgi:hypothetical protein
VKLIGWDSGCSSRSTLESPIGKKFRPQICYFGVIGIILSINTRNAFPLGIIKISEVQKSRSFVLTPLVHAAFFFIDCWASSPENGHIFRITFYHSAYSPHVRCASTPAAATSEQLEAVAAGLAVHALLHHVVILLAALRGCDAVRMLRLSCSHAYGHHVHSMSSDL